MIADHTATQTCLTAATLEDSRQITLHLRVSRLPREATAPCPSQAKPEPSPHTYAGGQLHQIRPHHMQIRPPVPGSGHFGAEHQVVEDRRRCPPESVLSASVPVKRPWSARVVLG